MPDVPEIVDLSNCDREPIHLLRAIQPFGFLVTVDSADWTITRASRNATEWIKAGADGLIGQPLDRFFTDEALHLVRRHLQTVMFTNTDARVFAVPLIAGQPPFDIARPASPSPSGSL